MNNQTLHRSPAEAGGGGSDSMLDPGARRGPDPIEVCGQHGSAVIEFAIVAPMLLVLVFLIVDLGFGFHAWDAAHNAAREGARVGALDPDVAVIEARVRGASDFLDQRALEVTIQCAPEGSSAFGACGAGPSWGEGDVVRVTVVYDHAFVTPLPRLVGLGESLSVQGISEARFEASDGTRP